MAKSKSGGKFSPRVADAVDGGGVNGALATIAEVAGNESFTYGGTQRGKEACAIHFEYEIEGFKQPWKEDYTLGPSAGWEVVDKGYGFKAVADQEGINKKCGFYPQLVAIEEAANAAGIDIDELISYDADENTFNVQGLEGRQVRLKQVDYETAGGDTKQKVVIGAFVTDAKAAKSNGNGKAAAKSNGKASGGNVEEKTADAIRELLEENARIKIDDLPNLVYDAHKKDKDAKGMMQQAMKEKWLADLNGVAFDKKKGVITAAEESDDDGRLVVSV